MSLPRRLARREQGREDQQRAHSSNDPSSATAAMGRVDCNSDAMPPFAASVIIYLPHLRGIVTLWEIMQPILFLRFQGIAWLLGYTQGVWDSEIEVVEQDLLEKFSHHLELARKECEQNGLVVSDKHLAEEIESIKRKPPIGADLSRIASSLGNTLRREMSSMKLFRLSADTQQYFDAANAFGEAVSKAFPSAECDIKESGNCLALSRATACVFHSMRVLEHGLCALADQFKVPFDNKSWNDVIEPIEKAIRQIKNQSNKPENWKEDEQFYSGAAAQFMHFKNAWRNYTAHKQFKYTEDEAEAIFRHVRDFMMHIAKRLKEKRLNP